MEAPDYSSDGESKGGGFFGLDNSMDNPFSALHGSLDMFAGPSGQVFSGEASHDAAQAYHQKLHSLDPRPCPICNRMYSNLSNLRQHVRLIHNPQTVACPLCSKPFKTKLYLKRHLMSFHELQCTNPANKQNIVLPTQGSPDFFPPPQVFLGPLSSNSHPTDDKVNLHNSLSKIKDFSPEYFHSPYHNLSNNGERQYQPQMGNAMELPSFPASQVCKEDGESPQTISEKPGMKNRDNSYVNSPPQVNTDFRSSFIPQQLGHGHPPNSDELTTYANANNEKAQSFLSSLSISKNVNVADYLDPEIHVNDQTSPKNIKEPDPTVNNN